MRVLSADEMRQMDRRSAEEFGVASLVLMENAGRSVARSVWELLHAGASEAVASPTLSALHDAGTLQISSEAHGRVAVVCGTGNNGGDGFVAARYLVSWGLKCTVLLSGSEDKLTGEALANYNALKSLGVAIHTISGQRQYSALRDADVVVDALFGTGLRGELSETATEIVQAMNGSGVPVICIDIPSGVHTDTGQTLGEAVQADVTVTFAAPKPAHLLFPGAALCGRTVVADIGIPSALMNAAAPHAKFLLTPGDVARMIPQRRPNDHKGTFGHAGIFAGSIGLMGAAEMAARSCLATGAGLTSVATPSRQHPILAGKLTEAMTVPLGKDASVFGVEDVDAALQASQTWDAVAIGCGIGRDPGTVEFVREFVAGLDFPVVIDADGLNALAGKTEETLRRYGQCAVLTPHPGEMARLLGTDVSAVQSNRLEVAAEAADEFGAVCVLKGAHTIVAEPHGRCWFCVTGNVGLAKGGSGDMLTGIIVALLAQGLPPVDAACAGVWIHGKAADIAAGYKAPAAILATDCIAAISDVYRFLEGPQ
ncbi:MAG: NAD(P)H-hydrate dehydratase [Armatimonadetes bacterium]|nr:NAD(P)H-hydrate dehydratase [Armatimonadota bacterium]